MWTGVVTKSGESDVYRDYVGGDRRNVEEVGLPPPPVGPKPALLQTAGVGRGTAGDGRDEALERSE